MLFGGSGNDVGHGAIVLPVYDLAVDKVYRDLVLPIEGDIVVVDLVADDVQLLDLLGVCAPIAEREL